MYKDMELGETGISRSIGGLGVMCRDAYRLVSRVYTDTSRIMIPKLILYLKTNRNVSFLLV